MAISVSPLKLLLDKDNPRFITLPYKSQAAIRKYLLDYEDICLLANDINRTGNLLKGERIVILKDNKTEKLTVIEGNRRTCALQLLLSRKLIPLTYIDMINPTNNSIYENCNTIEVDVVDSKEEAITLMSKRHISGIKQWPPLAKKQFFANYYKNGMSIEQLSEMTSIAKSEIINDIKDYNFFYYFYLKYKKMDKNFNENINSLKIDVFLRIFKVKCIIKDNEYSPIKILKIYYDNNYNYKTKLDKKLFDKIVLTVFKHAFVNKTITTRYVLSNINELVPLLEQIVELNDKEKASSINNTLNEPTCVSVATDSDTTKAAEIKLLSEPTIQSRETDKTSRASQTSKNTKPDNFFKGLRWGDLDQNDREYNGFISLLSELSSLSTTKYNGTKAYEKFPIATGMVLRSTYEQALKLAIKNADLWNNFIQGIKYKEMPQLKEMEEYIKCGNNKVQILPNKELVLSFDLTVSAKHRDFLNANVHRPDKIKVTPASLEAIASGGMFSLIQGIINIL